MCRCLRNGDGSSIGLLGSNSSMELDPVLELRCCLREIPRDQDRHVFGTMMREKLAAALKEQQGVDFTCAFTRFLILLFQVLYGIEGGDPQKVVWHKLLEFVHKHHLVVTNWPLGVAPPVPGFNFKKLKAGTLCKLVVSYLHRKLAHMYDGQTDNEEAQDLLADILEIEIKLWNEGMFCCTILFVLSAHMLSDIICIPDMSPTKDGVALIKAYDGMVLRTVADDPEWQKICEEGDHRREEAAAARPKTHGPSRKRPHMETMSSGNNQEWLDEPPLPDLPMVPHDQLPPVLPVRARAHPVGHCHCLNIRY